MARPSAFSRSVLIDVDRPTYTKESRPAHRQFVLDNRCNACRRDPGTGRECGLRWRWSVMRQSESGGAHSFLEAQRQAVVSCERERNLTARVPRGERAAPACGAVGDD